MSEPCAVRELLEHGPVSHAAPVLVGDDRPRGQLIDLGISGKLALVTGAKGDPLELTDDDYEAAWAIEFMSAVRIARSVVPAMTDKGWGRIVDVASENAVQSYADEMSSRSWPRSARIWCSSVVANCPRSPPSSRSSAPTSPASSSVPTTEWTAERSSP